MARSDPIDRVLAQYPPLPCPVVTPLGNHGGFSGARLWRIDSAAGSFCLRAWPVHVAAEQLRFIHDLLRRAAGLDFVPRVLPTRTATTFTQLDNRLWHVTTWMPGNADFHAYPAPVRIAAACTALAHLHGAWHEPHQPIPCPAVRRRLDALAPWPARLAAGWNPPADPIVPAARARALLNRELASAINCLNRWQHRPYPVQPCLCDVWHDHVLYAGDRVTGLIDYGSAKVDHVAVDLARLLGDMAGDDAALRAAGLAGYQQVRPLSANELRLIDDLDRSGTVVAAANWLRWLYWEGRVYPDRAAVARRTTALVERMERW